MGLGILKEDPHMPPYSIYLRGTIASPQFHCFGIVVVWTLSSKAEALMQVRQPKLSTAIWGLGLRV